MCQTILNQFSIRTKTVISTPLNRLKEAERKSRTEFCRGAPDRGARGDSPALVHIEDMSLQKRTQKYALHTGWLHSEESLPPNYEDCLLMYDIPGEDPLEMPDSRLILTLEKLLVSQRRQENVHGNYVDFIENDLLRLSTDVNWLVVYHDLYPRIVDFHFKIRRMRESQPSKEAMEPVRGRVIEEISRLHEAKDAKHLMEEARQDRNLNSFLERYCSSLQDLLHSLITMSEAAGSICADLDSRVARICETLKKTEEEGTKNPHPSSDNALSIHDTDESLQCVLIEKYKASILDLKRQFLRQKKTGKLPKSATSILKEWWKKNIVWPYPSEHEKKKFCDHCGLSPTQINNWFINQRKRHWHKLFKPGKIPENHTQARKILLRKGILKV